MNIGILTYHFAANYGAVLQAFALQSYLKSMGHNAVIIDYVPDLCSITLSKCFITRRIGNVVPRLKSYIKNNRINEFRDKNLVKYPCKYTSGKQLKENAPSLDAYVCGSDQIWNKHFVQESEGGEI